MQNAKIVRRLTIMPIEHIFKNPPSQEILSREAAKFGVKYPIKLFAYMSFMSAAGEMMNFINEVHSQCKISQARVRILMNIKRSCAPVPPSKIARELGLKKATITGLVSALEKQGLIKRTRDNADKRFYRVALTKKGLFLIKKIVPLRYKAMQKIMSIFEDGEMENIISNAERIKKAVKEEKNEKN